MPVRKIAHCHPEFIDIIYKVAHSLCVDLIEYEVEFGCEDVDSFLRGMYNVQLKGIKHGHKFRTNIVMKWHPEPKTRAAFREAYRREFVFYRHIVPKLLEIQRGFKNMEGLKIKFPNCIFTSIEYNRETIAIQGLYENGFKIRNRLRKMDLAHVSLVMKNLAKLHGLSFALAKTNGDEFAKICSLCPKDVQYFTPGPVPICMKTFYNASVEVVIDKFIKDKLEKFGPHILTVLYKCAQADSYSTICHGDCWNNNVLFKYSRHRPVEAIFVDYQLTRIASPVTDISYFLYMSTDKDFLLKHYEHVLEIYYGTLAGVLRQCNLDVNEVYPANIFQKHLREYTVLGLIEALVSMMIITAQNEEALKITEIKYEYCDETLCKDELQDRSLFVERVNGVVTDFFERNYSLYHILQK